VIGKNENVIRKSARNGMRRLMHLRFRLTRAMTLGVRAAVFDAQERIFLVRHTYVPGWHLPGGGVEPGQTLIQALEDELRQEAAMELSGKPQLHGVFFNNRTKAGLGNRRMRIFHSARIAGRHHPGDPRQA
jgi:8-oxo-dGTP pyrophosphatase MutT (NUDIX family)